MARKKSASKIEHKKILSLAQKEARWHKKQAQLIAKKQIQEMRPYLKKLKNIDLRKNISGAQRGYITRIWDEYTLLTSRPTKIYRSRKKKNVKLAQKFASHKTNIFDVAFIPTADKKVRVKVKNNKIILKGKYVEEGTVFFNYINLVKNPDKEIERVLKEFPHAKKYIIKAGEFEFNGALTAKQARKEIHNIMAKYSDVDANDFYQNWMGGIKVFSFLDQSNFIDYLIEYDKQRKTILGKKKNKRRSNERKFGTRF